MGRKPGSKNRPKHYDIDVVRAAASKRWPEILSALTGVSRETFEGRQHRPCPWCGGTDRFRPFDDDSGGCHCNQCFNTKNGDGFAVVGHANKLDFGKSLRAIADYLGIAPSTNGHAGGSSKESSDPAEHLEFREWCPGDQIVLAAGLLASKPGISLEAIQACGGRPARYRGQHVVVALPVYGPELLDRDPVGWCLYSITGGVLPIYKRGGEVEWKKIKLTGGSKPGLIGQVAALAKLRAAPVDPNDENPNQVVIWKCEGPSDVLAFITRTVAEQSPNSTAHIALTNANGANEKPHAWMAALFAGRRVNVVHDADKPGQDGAARWSTAIAATAFECRSVRLPYPIVPDHGPDLRDYFSRDGRSLDDLLALVEAASPVPPPSTIAAAAVTSIAEDDRDPHRLAKVFLESSNSLINGELALRFWRGEFWRWSREIRCYRAVPRDEFPAMVNATCKADFDRLAAEPSPDGEPRKPHVVSRAFVNNVIAALEAICLLSATVDPNSWLGDENYEPGKKLWLSMANGILRLDELLEDPDEPPVHDHSPLWFSPVALPYAFDPDAACPRFMEVLAQNQQHDAERIAILQEWAGYILTPSTDQQKFLVLEGDGANGKTVYLAALQAMIGPENVANVPLESFEDRFALTDTLGKLLNVSADVAEIEKAAEGKLKAFVSGDRLFFDRKGISGVNATPTARLVVAANNRPRFSDRSSGIWRRMLLVPWNIKITESTRITGLDKPGHWVESGELPGIFWWAVLGLARLRSQGRFSEAAACRDALDDYQTEANPAKAFLEENYVQDANTSVASKDIYSTYKKWCSDNGYRSLSDKIFGKEVRRTFPEVERKQSTITDGRHWMLHGIREATSQDF